MMQNRQKTFKLDLQVILNEKKEIKQMYLSNYIFPSVNNTTRNSPIVIFFLWLVSCQVILVGCTRQLLRLDGAPQPEACG